jgi:threonine dehydratase
MKQKKLKMKISKLDLLNAQTELDGLIHKTPVLSSSAINEILGMEVYFKCENFQKTGSFKARGASNALLKLSAEERKIGVATHSSGNHGQALAWAAQRLGIKCWVVMPEDSPSVKVAAVKSYGAEVHLCPANLAAREAGLAEVQARTGALFIPPYNHENIIIGQSTAAAELIREQPKLEAIFAPVGGGGLLAGTALSAHYFSPKTKVYAGEPAGADDAFRSFYSGQLVEEHRPKTIADGLRTTLGKLNFAIIKTHVSAIYTCQEDEIVAAMRLVYERLKIVIEPSCAVPLACLVNEAQFFSGQKVGLIISGGNVDLAKLPF